ncbi:hypothetical protein E4T56_gene7313 [Termitomyces sp. T112]|nr:hypothetical protein E4T56_gene7313 [Termitomyces sp. T112]
MPAYDRYSDNRPLALDGTIHYPRSILSLTVRNIIQNYYEARRLNYKKTNNDDDMDSNDEIDTSEEDRDAFDLMWIEGLQYSIDIRRAMTRSYSEETGIGYSKEVEVEDIKRWSRAGSDEVGLFSSLDTWAMSEAIKHRKEKRGPAPDGWKAEDKLLVFLWFIARCGGLFTVAI